MRSILHSLRPAALVILGALPASTNAAGVPEAVAAETQRHRAVLEAIPSSPLVDGERPRLNGLLNDVDSLLKARRISQAIETLASAGPGVAAISRAGAGWDDTGKGAGKHIDDLAKEWEEVGRALKADRARFPGAIPRSQTAFVRALAEQSFGQVDPILHSDHFWTS